MKGGLAAATCGGCRAGCGSRAPLQNCYPLDGYNTLERAAESRATGQRAKRLCVRWPAKRA